MYLCPGYFLTISALKKIAAILLLLTLIVPFYGTWSWLELRWEIICK
jgi:hypothetical protein